tara:strand:- start:85 stop:459 length:375 start_codon:yes stop_codon:yes gene_type:complete
MSNNDITVTMSMKQYEELKRTAERNGSPAERTLKKLRSTEDAYEKSRKEVAMLSERCNILLERIKTLHGLTAEEESYEELYKVIVFNDVDYQINLDDNRVIRVDDFEDVGEWDPKRERISFDQD